jgi:hypothetical protein
MALKWKTADLETTRLIESDGGQVNVRTVTQDDRVIRSTSQMRSRGKRSGRHDLAIHPKGAKIAYHFQAHPIPWARAKMAYPELFKDLLGRDQFRRELAAQRLAKMHPEWVVTKPRSVEPQTAQAPVLHLAAS